MPDLGCDHCDEEFADEREKIEHVLEEHDDEITSHKRDTLKRKRNKLQQPEGSSSDLKRYLKPALGVVAVIAVVGGLAMSGIVNLDSNPSTSSGDATISPGAPGSAHEHAQFDVVINGNEIPFSRPRYQFGQTRNRYIHFEGGDGQTIHKHATDVTIDFAMDALNMGLTANCIETYSGQRYCEDSGNLTVTVNGQQVNASTYVIQDGDQITVRYTSAGGGAA
ncbi:MAG: hypothetical protein SV186_01545 [Candidatus Nanohaloarchaea archaeon]|nr:hypothetical protein [Candidatus Nanohaloarchaea archaeon]